MSTVVFLDWLLLLLLAGVREGRLPVSTDVLVFVSCMQRKEPLMP